MREAKDLFHGQPAIVCIPDNSLQERIRKSRKWGLLSGLNLQVSVALVWILMSFRVS